MVWWSGGWCWDMCQWQCVSGWHGGGVMAMFFLLFVVAGARGRGIKRGKGREREIIIIKNKKRIFK